MSGFTVGQLMEFIQGLDDDISIELNAGNVYYNIVNARLLFNQGAANERLVSITLGEAL